MDSQQNNNTDIQNSEETPGLGFRSRNPLAETLTHPVNTDEDTETLRDSIRETVATSPVPYIAAYSDTASFRTQEPVTADEQQQIARIRSAVQLEPNACYRNAKLALATWSLDGTLEYGEGVIVEPDIGHLVTHAWVELNSKVVDLTLNDPHPEIEYYGQVFPAEQVLTQDEDGSISANPVMLTETGSKPADTRQS